MKTIFALVGPAKTGKTTLIEKVVSVIPESVGIIKSVTTRAQRNEQDARSYVFITEKEFEKKRDCDEFVECIEHAGNWYAYEKKMIEEMLAKKHGICAATEHGVLQLRKAGFKIKPIKILAIGNEEMQRRFYNDHPGREEADRERRSILIPAERTIIDSFIAPDGLEKAMRELISFILSSE